MDNFVTDKAIFQCAASPGNRFRCREPSGHVAKQGSRLLTVAAELSAIPGEPCVVLTPRNQGTPTPCSARFTGWQNTDHARTVRGNALLTASSFRTCLECGAPVKLQMDRSQIDSPVRQGSDVSITSLPGLAPLAFTAAEQERASASVCGENGVQGAREAVSPAAAAAQGVAKPGETPLSPSPGEGRAAGTEEKKVRSVFRCPRCGQKEGCAYRKEADVTWESEPDTPGSVNNDAQTLLDNYEKYTGPGEGPQYRESDAPDAHYLNQTTAHRAYVEAMAVEQDLRDENSDAPWLYATHHIISGNQAFALHPMVVRMAHHAGYDINCARNCIRLLTNEKSYGSKPLSMRASRFRSDEGDMTQTIKMVSAREAMRRGKLQWHVGGHRYMGTLLRKNNVKTIRSRIEFYTKKKVKEKLRDYATLLEEDLGRIETEISKDLLRRRLCPAEFVEQMDMLCAKIRGSLAAFSDGYHKSYPWYVSREAFCFAFEVPPSFVIIGVRRVQDGLLLERCRISRKQNGTVTIDPEAGRIVRPAWEEEAQDRSCIGFCKNVRLFVFFGQCGQSSLPFETDQEHIRRISSGDTDFYRHIEEKAEEYFLWAQNVSGEEYMAPTAMIRARLAEYAQEKQRRIPTQDAEVNDERAEILPHVCGMLH